MIVHHALEPLRKSIFLAGPTPRLSNVVSWRPRALEIIKSFGFDGVVFVPEARDWKPHKNYHAQIDWEWNALNQATIVAFWIPRDLVTMPAFTTNVEFGMLASSGKVVLGSPPNAPKNAYLHEVAKRYHIHTESTLEATMELAVIRTNGFSKSP